MLCNESYGEEGMIVEWMNFFFNGFLYFNVFGRMILLVFFFFLGIKGLDFVII